MSAAKCPVVTELNPSEVEGSFVVGPNLLGTFGPRIKNTYWIDVEPGIVNIGIK
jgi:hypothetical protein